ncbi:MAG: ABC transporter permease [Planctomycetes bacterium]|nr:ABC transporter permease [Planctomycetota bacterium]
MAAVASAIEFRDFGLAQRRTEGDEVLFEGASLELAEHGFYLLVGTSGGGKSSLLRVLAGLVEAREPAPVMRGDVSVRGQSLRGEYPAALRRVTTAILQDEGLIDDLSPRENVELALRAAGRSVRLAPALLAQAGIEEPPAQTAMLSGGMRKRVAVARAMASSPQLLLCDEPTAGLDPDSARAIAVVLREAHDAGADRTTIVITHDLSAFAGLCDGVLVLDGRTRTLRLEAPDHVPQAAVVGELGAASERLPPPIDLHGLRRLLLRAAAIGETLTQALRSLPPVELRETLRTTARFVLDPAAFVALCGAILGGLATFFALRNNPVEGAFESALLTGTGKVATAVLVPLFSGLFFTARIVAGAAARLGTMKRTNQIAALTMMGVRPADYLLTPILWGMTLAMCVVTFVGVVAAAVAAAVASWLVSGFTPAGWAAAWFAAVTAQDLAVVLAKAGLSGFAAALCCYHLATGPKRSGAEVGEAVNAAIVIGMGLVLAIHAILTFVVYT